MPEVKEVQSPIEPKGDEKIEITAKDLYANYGASGTGIFSGMLDEEYKSELKGLEGMKTYDRMRKSDSQVNATLLSMELPIRSTERKVEGEDEEMNAFVSENLFEYMNSTRDDFLREALTMLCFGFSLFEKVYEMKEDKIVLKKLAFRKQTTVFRRETSDGKAGITQLLPSSKETGGENQGSSNIDIPAGKLLLFSHRREGENYEGISSLRSAYKHRFIKDKLYNFDAIRHERQAVGIPVINLPVGATEADKNYAYSIVKNIRVNEQTGIVLPGGESSGWKFSFATMNASDSTGYEKMIEHHNREIAKNVLAQFLELGNTASGSRSLGESQTNFFMLGLDSICKNIADTINKYVVKELIDLNFDGVEVYPKLTFRSLLESGDKFLQIDKINELVAGGIITMDEDIENKARSVLGLEEKEEVEEVPEEDPMDTGTLDQQDQELQDMESQLDQEDFSDQISTEEFSSLSEEQKRKISEALKLYRKTNGKKAGDTNRESSKSIESIKNQKSMISEASKKQIGEVKARIDGIRSGLSAIPKGKAGKPERDRIRGEIQKAREEIRTMRENKRQVMDKLGGDLAIQKESNKQSKKAIREEMKSARDAERQAKKDSKKKKYEDHHHDHFFSEMKNTFGEALDFISTIQKNG